MAEEKVVKQEKKKADAKAKAAMPVQMAAPAPGTKRVKALVNSSLHDGTQLKVGAHCDLHEAEYDRLKKDSRGPFFEEV